MVDLSPRQGTEHLREDWLRWIAVRLWGEGGNVLARSEILRPSALCRVLAAWKMVRLRFYFKYASMQKPLGFGPERHFVETKGIEPSTSGLQSRRSPS